VVRDELLEVIDWWARSSGKEEVRRTDGGESGAGVDDKEIKEAAVDGAGVVAGAAVTREEDESCVAIAAAARVPVDEGETAAAAAVTAGTGDGTGNNNAGFEDVATAAVGADDGCGAAATSEEATCCSDLKADEALTAA
jgi:hypothetical protein